MQKKKQKSTIARALKKNIIISELRSKLIVLSRIRVKTDIRYLVTRVSIPIFSFVPATCPPPPPKGHSNLLVPGSNTPGNVPLYVPRVFTSRRNGRFGG